MVGISLRADLGANRPLRPIIVLFTGHVGSSWLIDMIGNHPWCVRLGFEPIDDAISQKLDLSPVLERILNWNGNPDLPNPFRPVTAIGRHTSHFCFKTRLRLEQPEFFTRAIPQHNPVLIHLTRFNWIKAAVSNYKRERLGISHLENMDDIEAKQRPVIVDCNYVLRKAEQFLRRDGLIEVYKRYLPFEVPTVSYEALLRDTSGTLAALGRHLDLPFAAQESMYRKMTSDDLRRAIDNYDELADAAAATGQQDLMEARPNLAAAVADLSRPTQPVFYAKAAGIARMFNDNRFAEACQKDKR